MNKILNFTGRYHNFFQQSKAYRNPMEIPRLKYVVISTGCGKHHKDTAKLEYITDELTHIAGQKCVTSKIKKSISNFGVREGAVVGAYVTLRRQAMHNFIDRFILMTLPRMQELTGLSTSAFDSAHNYNIGLKRQDIFIESKGLDLFGLNICIGIHSKSKKDSYDLLKAIGFPLYPIGGINAKQ